MKKEEFLSELKEIMEIEDSELTEDTVLRDMMEFNSLALMGIIALIDENFDMVIEADAFEKVSTIKDIMKLIGMDKFEK
ncbi:MAG: acyl carrier protein [Proteobacteria bacterium]|nr:acyl carrier protein [Pseudomonadota bacterium]